MPTLMRQPLIFCLLCAALLATGVRAETNDYLEEDPYADPNAGSGNSRLAEPPPEQQPPARKNKRGKPGPRHYMTQNAKEPRTDAGVFHVGFAAGGNFYIEPRYDNDGRTLTGDFFKDFGFQMGVYFDHDYSELDENIPLMLRGMVGYKYILASVHVFTFDGMVRHMFRFSEHASFGVGMGASAAIWYRAQTTASNNEQMIFLPTVLVGAGFEFNPFMVDFKWAINRWEADDIRMGFELYFGFRL